MVFIMPENPSSGLLDEPYKEIACDNRDKVHVSPQFCLYYLSFNSFRNRGRCMTADCLSGKDKAEVFFRVMVI